MGCSVFGVVWLAGWLVGRSVGQLVGWSVSRLVSQPLGSSVMSLFSGWLLAGRLLNQLSGPLVVRSFSDRSWVACENIEIEEEGNADNENNKVNKQ